jgi:ribosome biogenesis GTPase
VTHDFDFDALTTIGWRGPIEAAALEGDERLARVAAQHRSGYHVHDGRSEFAVQAPANLTRGGADPRRRPCVGDWVVIGGAGAGVIRRVLERRTELTRLAAGERVQHQLVAANVDVVLIVCGLDQDFNLRRIERYLAWVQGTGALPVVVLTKRDLAPDWESQRDTVQLSAGPATVVLALNAKDPDTRTALAPFLGPGDTGVLVGSSGAGKSTLTNTLLGVSKQRTGAVRSDDDRGRHTTTHRALLALPGGGCLIDTPGMRELKLSGEEDLAAGQFAEIEALAGRCRFRDCSHDAEPGCAVQAALASGALDPERYAHFRKLEAELAATRDTLTARQQRKSNAKVLTRAANKRIDEKYGRH